MDFIFYTHMFQTAGKARDKTQHLAGETVDPLPRRAFVSVLVCANGMGVCTASTERRCVTNRCFHPRARDSVPISLA